MKNKWLRADRPGPGSGVSVPVLASIFGASKIFFKFSEYALRRELGRISSELI
jgi:hypothetical protein